MATLKTLPHPPSSRCGPAGDELILSVSKRELLTVASMWLALALDVPPPRGHLGGVPDLLVSDGKGRQRRLYFTVDPATP